MKIGLFADAHYSSQALTCGKRRNNLSLGKLKAAYAYFAEQNCGLAISLGDLTDKNGSHALDVRHLEEISEVIACSGIETLCIMGNHDAFMFTKEEYYGILGGCAPADRTADGLRLLFADTCYFKNGKHYTPAGATGRIVFCRKKARFSRGFPKAICPPPFFCTTISTPRFRRTTAFITPTRCSGGSVAATG